MTGDSPKRVLPIWALALDLFGTLLLALGIYAIVSGGLPLAGDANAQGIGIALIIVGVLLMMPLVVVLVRRAVAGK